MNIAALRLALEHDTVAQAVLDALEDGDQAEAGRLLDYAAYQIYLDNLGKGHQSMFAELSRVTGLDLSATPALPRASSLPPPSSEARATGRDLMLPTSHEDLLALINAAGKVA